VPRQWVYSGSGVQPFNLNNAFIRPTMSDTATAERNDTTRIITDYEDLRPQNDIRMFDH